MAGDEDNMKAMVARLEEDVHAYTEGFTSFEGTLDKRLKSIKDSNETFTQTLASIMIRLDAQDACLGGASTAATCLLATNTGLQ